MHRTFLTLALLVATPAATAAQEAAETPSVPPSSEADLQTISGVLITLVWNEGRWWVASIAWDEEVGAGPIPDTYLPN